MLPQIYVRAKCIMRTNHILNSFINQFGRGVIICSALNNPTEHNSPVKVMFIILWKLFNSAQRRSDSVNQNHAGYDYVVCFGLPVNLNGTASLDDVHTSICHRFFVAYWI